jgi:hypothetical protein
MTRTKTLLALAFLLAPAAASAQGYYGGGGGGYYSSPQSKLPGGFHNRQGHLIFGGSIGLGAMKENGESVECINCDYSPIAVSGSLHLGGFISPRLALMGEIQGNVQTLEVDDYGDTYSLVQSALLAAAQYWLTPQLWIKGGIGLANLRVDHSYYGTVDEVPETGIALLGGIGYELLSAPRFSIDVQGRIITGSYDSVDDHVTSGTIGLGINWF